VSKSPASSQEESGAAGSGTFNADNELTKAGSVSYAYNEVGQRTKATPEVGPASTYGYDQAGNLTSVNRPEAGETPKIEDSYTYDGTGLRASETVNGATKHLTWQLTGLPLLLSDGANSYIYGPEGLPVERINNEEHATYLHHDQQGSTRLLTSEAGGVQATFTYDAYGNLTGHTGTATTPLGYDGQYTTSDTGLIYLRARVYDPATAQFLSVDPAVAATGTPYLYTNDNPLTYTDRSGLALEEIEGSCWGCGSPIPLLPPALKEAIAKGIEGGAKAVEEYLVANAAEDEGESELKELEAKEAACQLVELDKKGRVKGNLPSYPPSDWTQEELEQAEEDLRASIDRRREEMNDRGEEGKHRNRLSEEEKLLRQIEKKLGGS
jgi:RHS repeat-associated protein